LFQTLHVVKYIMRHSKHLHALTAPDEHEKLLFLPKQYLGFSFAIASAKMESLAHLYQVLCSWQYLHLYNGFNYTNEQICMRKDESPLLVLR